MGFYTRHFALAGVVQQIHGRVDEEQIIGADADDVLVLSPQKGPVFLVLGEIGRDDEHPGNDPPGDEREIGAVGSIGHPFGGRPHARDKREVRPRVAAIHIVQPPQGVLGIDQIGNYAGTGYGRSGLEFLALGIPTITEIPSEYEILLSGHPFVNATLSSFEEVLYHLISDKQYRDEKREQGVKWVRTFPHPKRIMGEIYSQYRRLGWI